MDAPHLLGHRRLAREFMFTYATFPVNISEASWPVGICARNQYSEDLEDFFAP